MLCNPFFCRPYLSLIISILVSQPLLLNYSHNTCSLNLACSFNLACLFEVGLEAYCTICKFQLTRMTSHSTRTTLKCRRLLQPYFKSRKGINQTNLRHVVTNKISHQLFFPRFAQHKKRKKNTTNELLTRTKCCIYEIPYVAAPIREQGDVIVRTPPYTRLPSDAPTRTRIFLVHE